MEYKHSENQIWLENEDGKQVALIEFPDIEEATVNIVHTEVDPSLQGQGIASKLCEEVAKKLRLENKKAVASCSYAIRWFAKHEEYHDVLADVEQLKTQAQQLSGQACGIKK